MIKIGCVGFPVRQSLVFQNLDFLEVGDGSALRTRNTTLKRWREAAGPDFEFAIRAPTAWIDPVRAHGLRWKSARPSGNSTGGRDQQIRNFKTVLNSHLIIFDIPASLSPSPDRITRLQNIFRSLSVSDFVSVWQPPRSWPITLVERFSHALKLVPALNPLKDTVTIKTPFHYFRIQGPAGTRLRDAEMQSLRRQCGNRPSYLLFDFGPTSYYEALRFSHLIGGPS